MLQYLQLMAKLREGEIIPFRNYHKNMELSKRTLKQIKNLSNVCEFDLQNMTATVQLHYADLSDFIDIHLSRPEKPVVSDIAVDYILDIISDIPKEFNVDFHLTVDDYGEYTHEHILEALKLTVENTYYYYDDTRKKDNVLAVIFIMLGVIIFAINSVGGDSGWFGSADSINKSIIGVVLDVLTWALLWEGAAILLLTYANESTVFGKCMRRFNGILFKDKSGNTLSSMDRDGFYKDWIYLKTGEGFSRSFILFSNVFLFLLISVEMLEFAGNRIYSGNTFWTYLLNWILIFALMVSNISFYREKGKFKKLALPVSLVAMLYNLYFVVYGIVSKIPPNKNFVISCLFFICIAVNVVCIIYMNKQNVTIKEQK